MSQPTSQSTSPHDTYTSPLAARNASPEMCKIWSPRHKFTTWRKIWLAVAQAQQACGLDITDQQINEMKAALDVTDEDMDNAAKYERELRHDVMAHVHAFADRCPTAKGIIHLGCTSQDVVCNADFLILRESIDLIRAKSTRAIVAISEFGDKYKSLPTLGFTHYQPAQPTTVGRRACQWASEMAPDSALFRFANKHARGFRGATGTQASFLSLFDGDSQKVDRFEVLAFLHMLPNSGAEWYVKNYLDDDFIERERDEYREHARKRLDYEGLTEEERVDAQSNYDKLQAMSIEDYRASEFDRVRNSSIFDLSGQTYPRVVDTRILSSLASIASVLHKIATDIRLLSNRKEIDEPFGKNQIGSSAMPYKRNPMKCERICGLTRFVMNLVGNAYDTAATQWLERTLDDSSNRRLSLPEAFLALDGALDLMHTVASGLVVNEAMVRKNLMLELPFMATENILMEAVKAGGDRQDLHEKIRVHSQAAGHRVKQEGLDNDLIDRLKNDPDFASIHHMLTEDQILNPMNFIGRSVEQTERFLKEVVEPLKSRYKDELDSLGSADRGV
tara:strand:+ start:238799 stop:240481 length:1683 start_codon:yes stop_codon:yes gene_type:complete